MQEAWFLFDLLAIRTAAGNGNGDNPLALPSINELDTIPDPKERLYDLLRQATELGGRRLKKFRPEQWVTRIAERAASGPNGFAPLRALPAFRALEQDLSSVLQENGWI
jgi:hypothetical protein